MDKTQILVYAFCGLIMVGTCVLCFLPTIFYVNPVKVPGQVKPSSSNISPTAFILPSFPCNPPLIFHNDSGFCKPPCNWLPFTDDQQDAFILADWISGIFCLTSFALVLATWLKIPEFMRFPHLIVLLIVGGGALIGVFVLIPRFSKRSTFFCSSVFLDEAIKTPTAFCQVQGAAIQYISLVLGGWFVVYNATLLKNLVFDKLPNVEHRKSHLIIWSILCFSLPLIPVIYVLTSDHNYTPMYLRACFAGNSELAFYSNIFPQQICLSVGTTCLLIVIFKLIKERKSSLIGSRSQANIRQIKLRRVAVRFIMVIVSFIISVYFSYGLISVQLSNSQAYKKTLTQYFQCLIFSQACPKGFLKYQTSYGLHILNILAINVFQGGTLAFLAGNKKARSLWCSWLLCLVPKCRALKRNPAAAVGEESERSTDDKNQPCETNEEH